MNFRSHFFSLVVVISLLSVATIVAVTPAGGTERSDVLRTAPAHAVAARRV
jgi:hypothetical protein